jgi:hypothetical protein
MTKTNKQELYDTFNHLSNKLLLKEAKSLFKNPKYKHNEFTSMIKDITENYVEISPQQRVAIIHHLADQYHKMY